MKTSCIDVVHCEAGVIIKNVTSSLELDPENCGCNVVIPLIFAFYSDINSGIKQCGLWGALEAAVISRHYTICLWAKTY